MATLTTLRNVVARKIGLDNTASSADQTLIDEWINQGVTDFLLQTKCKVGKDTMSLTAGTADYTLDTGIMSILEVYVTSSSSQYPFEEVTVPELLNMRRAGSTTNSPVRYYAVAGANMLMVHPTPAAADTITVYYVPRPATLSGGSDTPTEIPAEFHKAVELFALAEAGDYRDDKSSAQGQRYKEQYDQWVMKAKKYVNSKGNSRRPKIYPGPSSYAPNSRSADQAPW